MTDNDQLLAEIAQIIVEAYNEECDHVLPDSNYVWKHTGEGYALLSSDTEITDKYIYDFVEHVFRELAGKKDIKWNKVYTSKTVITALEKRFDMKIDLSNIGYNHKMDAMGNPELPPRPTIYASVDLKANPDAWNTMDEKGFTYLDRNMWMIEL